MRDFAAHASLHVLRSVGLPARGSDPFPEKSRHIELWRFESFAGQLTLEWPHIIIYTALSQFYGALENSQGWHPIPLSDRNSLKQLIEIYPPLAEGGRQSAVANSLHPFQCPLVRWERHGLKMNKWQT